jgi:hypothetical protein
LQSSRKFAVRRAAPEIVPEFLRRCPGRFQVSDSTPTHWERIPIE